MRHTIIIGLLAACAVSAAEPADYVFWNVTIHTLDPARPRARAIATRRDRITGLGDAVDPAWIGTRTQVYDLAGSTIVPGLWDAHGHLLSLGQAEREVDLVGTRSYAEVVERVAARAKTTPRGEWILGRGWDQNDWADEAMPDHAALSAATPEHPVLLSRIDGHAALANARALALAKVTRDTQAPAGGEVLKRADGEPTGVLVDAAISLIPEPSPSAAEVEEALLAGARACARLGLVGVHDAGVSPATLAALERLQAAGTLPLRVYAMHADGPGLEGQLRRGPWSTDDGRLHARAVKLFMDGALGSRGAWLLAPYADRPESRGLPQSTPEQLLARIRQVAKAGLQPCTHAIGDAGVRAVLDACEAVDRETGGALRRLRPRVEHAQVISPADLPRFGTLGVLASMQPTHCTSDMPWAEARLGAERIRGAYAWAALRKAGAGPLPLGSDFPVEGANPLWGIHAAVTRLAADGTSPHGPGGWYPGERLTREEALRGFTEWACYGAGLEREGGTIELGKWADLTVLRDDPLTCPADRLRDVQVRITMVGGRPTYAVWP